MAFQFNISEGMPPPSSWDTPCPILATGANDNGMGSGCANGSSRRNSLNHDYNNAFGMGITGSTNAGGSDTASRRDSLLSISQLFDMPLVLSSGGGGGGGIGIGTCGSSGRNSLGLGNNFFGEINTTSHSSTRNSLGLGSLFGTGCDPCGSNNRTRNSLGLGSCFFGGDNLNGGIDPFAPLSAFQYSVQGNNSGSSILDDFHLSTTIANNNNNSSSSSSNNNYNNNNNTVATTQAAQQFLRNHDFQTTQHLASVNAFILNSAAGGFICNSMDTNNGNDENANVFQYQDNHYQLHSNVNGGFGGFGIHTSHVQQNDESRKGSSSLIQHLLGDKSETSSETGNLSQPSIITASSNGGSSAGGPNKSNGGSNISSGTEPYSNVTNAIDQGLGNWYHHHVANQFQMQQQQNFRSSTSSCHDQTICGSTKLENYPTQYQASTSYMNNDTMIGGDGTDFLLSHISPTNMPPKSKVSSSTLFLANGHFSPLTPFEPSKTFSSSTFVEGENKEQPLPLVPFSSDGDSACNTSKINSSPRNISKANSIAIPWRIKDQPKQCTLDVSVKMDDCTNGCDQDNDGEEIADDEDNEDDDNDASRFKPFHEEKWTLRYKELIEFHARNGHASVPHTYPPNPQLARWVKRQRRQFKLRNESRQSTMTLERLDMLNNVGFIWDSHDVNWREKLDCLLEFKRENNHCNVPSNFRDKKLATWVKCQRRQYKLYCDDKPSAMTKERITELEKVNFEWEIRTTNCSVARSDRNSTSTSPTSRRRTSNKEGLPSTIDDDSSNIQSTLMTGTETRLSLEQQFHHQQVEQGVNHHYLDVHNMTTTLYDSHPSVVLDV